MTEPFARADGECVVIGDTPLQAATHRCRLVQDAADRINTAARKYAADKIREAVKVLCPSDIPGIGIGFLEARRQMLARADAVERGEA